MPLVIFIARRVKLFRPVGYPSAGQIIGGEFNGHLVAG